MPPEVARLTARFVLFDLDGTLISSLAAVERAWTRFSRLHGLEPERVLHQIHGRRSIDSIRALLPFADAEREDARIRAMEAEDTDGVVCLPGARELIASLPADRWGIVTSGTSDVATARVRAAGLPVPRIFVCGEHVLKGKPDPEPFEAGAKLAGVAPSECVGVEDTRPGIISVLGAGLQAIAIGDLDHDPRVKSLADVSVVVRTERLDFIFNDSSDRQPAR